MIIPIDDKHQITSDANQWILQEKTESKSGPGSWKSVGFYSSLESLINSLYDRKLRRSDVVGLEEAIREAKNIATTLKQALKPLFTVSKNPI